jgi:hypothetical protein
VDDDLGDPEARAHGDERLEVVPAGVHAAVGDQADEVHALEALEGRAQDRVLGERPVGDGLVDPGEVLLDDRPGAEVEVADLAVAHLALRQPDRRPARGQLRVREALEQPVEDRRAGEVDGVAGPGRGDPPAVEDDEDGGGERHGAAP